MKRTTPIVMIHGAFCGGWAFEQFRLPFESEGYEVSTPTLRNHAPNSVRSGLRDIASLSDYAGDLQETLARLDGPPVLVGHSLGGLLAQIIAARQQVRAAILLAPCAPWGVLQTTLFELLSSQSLMLAGDYWNQMLTPNFGVAVAHSLDKLSRSRQAKVFERFVPESGLATFEILHWVLDYKRASHVPARNVTCPILCLTGSGDRINPPSTVRRIAERYEGRAVFEELPNHSHWLIGEPGWESIAGRALVWLGKILDEVPAPLTV